MVDLKDIRQIGEYEWEIPKSHREDMRASRCASSLRRGCLRP